jgi:isopentenyldiphosphate isomerase
MSEPVELLDLFDVQELVISVVSRHKYYKNKADFPGYLRSAEMFIINDSGQLWVPRRTPTRLIAPNGLDYSCGGHVTSGETYLTGCIREANEELNLRINETDLELAFVTGTSAVSPWFRQLFLYHSNVTPDYNTSDFSEYYWLTPRELIDRLEAGEPAKESLLITVKKSFRL